MATWAGIDIDIDQVGGYCSTSNMKLVIKVKSSFSSFSSCSEPSLQLSSQLSPQVGESIPLKSENEGKIEKLGEEKEAKEGEGERREKVEREKEESEGLEQAAQVLQSQELLLKRKDSQEDQRPMEQVSLPDEKKKEKEKGEEKEKAEEKEMEREKKEEKEMEDVKTKKWTWSEMNISGNKQQKQEEPSLLAILRFLGFKSKD